MSDEAYTPCERCRQPIDRDDPSLVRAVEVRIDYTFQGHRREVPALLTYFHPECWNPGDPRYKLAATE